MRILFVLLVVAFSGSSTRGNNSLFTSLNPLDSIAPLEKDVSSIDGLVAALYEVISGPAGEKRNWERMRTLFIQESKMMSTTWRPDGSMTKRVRSVEEYISTSGPLLEKEGFFEREIGRTTEQYGGIVQIFSAYDSRRALSDTTPFARGINSIQLWNDGKRWWIVSILWQSETADNPIPQKFLH